MGRAPGTFKGLAAALAALAVSPTAVVVAPTVLASSLAVLAVAPAAAYCEPATDAERPADGGVRRPAAPKAAGHSAASEADSPLRFVIEPYRLPFIHVGDFELVLLTNGAFVLHRNGRCVMHGGVTFREKGWKRWGAQARRTSDGDEMDVVDSGRVLAFRSIMRDLDRHPFFEIDERVEAHESRFSFDYRLRALESLELENLGAEFSMPVAELLRSTRRVLFGKRLLAVPAKTRGQFVGHYPATFFSLLEKGTPIATVRIPKALRWNLMDDRPFGQNKARTQFVCAIPGGKVEKGQEIALSFDLVLDVIRESLRTRLGSFDFSLDDAGSFEAVESGIGWEGGLWTLSRRQDGSGVPAILAPVATLRPVNSGNQRILFAGRTGHAAAEVGTEYRLKAQLSGSWVKFIYRLRSVDLRGSRELGLLISRRGPQAEAEVPGLQGNETEALVLSGTQTFRLEVASSSFSTVRMLKRTVRKDVPEGKPAQETEEKLLFLPFSVPADTSSPYVEFEALVRAVPFPKPVPAPRALAPQEGNNKVE